MNLSAGSLISIAILIIIDKYYLSISSPIILFYRQFENPHRHSAGEGIVKHL
jgi:hypothetical protein